MIGVIGLGYVGLPLVVEFAEAGHDIVAIDISEDRVSNVNAGVSFIEDVPSERLQGALSKITASTSYDDLRGADAIIICVPTPLTENREPELGPLRSAAASIAPIVHRGQTVILESTTYPGTTRDLVAPLLAEGSGLVAGTDFHLAFSPERVDPGRTDYTLRTTPKVVGGLTETCTDAAVGVYSAVCDHLVPVSSPEVAELTKLHENIFRSVNIAMVNEMSILCDRMGIDIWEVVDAASTKPYGFMRFEPGPGMGGHCLPVDPFYLSWQARKFDLTTRFIELAGEMNQQMPRECAMRVVRALNEVGKPVKGAKVAIFGVSYKAGVGDVRESPALKIIEFLDEMGADIRYTDRHVPEIREFGLQSQTPDAALEDSDVAVIVTIHPDIDHAALLADHPATVDLRGALRNVRIAG